MVEPLLTAVHTGQQARLRVAAYPEAVSPARPYAWTHRRPDSVPCTSGSRSLPRRPPAARMFADVTLVTQVATEALVVPLDAVLTEGAEQFVFVENGDTYSGRALCSGSDDATWRCAKDSSLGTASWSAAG